MAEFIEFHDQRRYHKGIGNVRPADVYYGWREEILGRREEQTQRTLYERIECNLGQKSNGATGELQTHNRSLSEGLKTDKLRSPHREA